MSNSGGGYVPPGATTNDFWRSQPSNALPDGVTDPADAVSRTGLVGFGSGFPAAVVPVAEVDVAVGARTGTDTRVAGVTPLYVTALLPLVPSISNGGVLSTTPTGAVEFKHSNQTVGIGVGYNGLFVTGSNPNNNFALQNRGNGQFDFTYQAKNSGNRDYLNYASPVATTLVGQGFQQRWFEAGVTRANWYPQFTEKVGPVNARMQWDITANGGLVDGLRLAPSYDDTGLAVGTMLWVGTTQVINKKLVLFDNITNSQHQFYGFGINASTLRYQINGTASFNRWYAATSASTSNFILSLSGLGNLAIDPAGTSNGGYSGPLLMFGGENSGRFISSKSTAGGNVGGLDLGVGSTTALSISAARNIRAQHHGQTADGNYAFPGGGLARFQIDDGAGSGGGEQQPMLWLAINNCGAPCGQGLPPALVLQNQNGTSGQSGRISWVDTAGAAEIGSINMVSGNVLRATSPNTQLSGTTGTVVLLTNNIARVTVRNNGVINIQNAPTFATDVLAGAGGLVTGDVYKTPLGLGLFSNLCIKL